MDTNTTGITTGPISSNGLTTQENNVESAQHLKSNTIGAEVFFHLGFPKVASTFCQVKIFPNLNDIVFYTKHNFEKYKKLADEKVSGRYLFSTETDRGLEKRVKEVLEAFPEAKMIMCFREHDDWILSKYKYHIRKNGGMKFREFFDIHADRGFWKKDELLYQNKVQFIEKHCKEKPLVLTYDLLKKSPDAFLEKLTGFMQTSLKPEVRKYDKVHTAFSEKQLIILRAYNRRFDIPEVKTPFRFINKTHGLIRKFSIHIVAFFSRFIPNSFMKHRSLLSDEDKEDLKLIRAYYKEDWAFCRQYSS